MARWLVTEGDHQFAARDIQELKDLAKSGRITAGSMVQPPGAADWLYATEIPELKPLFKKGAADSSADDDLPEISEARARSRQRGIIALLLVVAVVGGWFFYKYASSLPNMEELSLLGGPYGLAITEMLVTEPDAPLRAEPKETARVLQKLQKDSKIQLIAKQRGWYNVSIDGGTKGWLAVGHVVPAYYFADARDRENYDPIYNPDNYLLVTNSRWMQLPDRQDENVTVFEFLLHNKSKFDMTNLKLLATIKDKRGNVLEEKEIAVEGVVPSWDSVVIGTWNPPENDLSAPKRVITYHTFTEYALENEDLWLQWSDGVEVNMASMNYQEANIDLLQAQAVPAKKKKR